MYRVTRQPIDIQSVIGAVIDPGAGAVTAFIGTARSHNEGRRVVSLEYDGYVEMAERELARLGEEAGRRWPLTRMAIVHRIGPVALAEASVVIAVSAAHRDDAFSACRFAIEEIKRTVPIWKKEIFEGGEVWIGTQSGEPLETAK